MMFLSIDVKEDVVEEHSAEEESVPVWHDLSLLMLLVVVVLVLLVLLMLIDLFPAREALLVQEERRLRLDLRPVLLLVAVVPTPPPPAAAAAMLVLLLPHLCDSSLCRCSSDDTIPPPNCSNPGAR
jgi:hypothetical protein